MVRLKVFITTYTFSSFVKIAANLGNFRVENNYNSLL